MAYNAMLRDEKTGETLLLWAILSEQVTLENEITGEPIDTKKTGGQINSEVLADHIHHLPLTLSVVADLTGDPALQGVGGDFYELEQYNRLVAFTNRDTTFSYTSYIFTNHSPLSERIIPGLEFPFLGFKRLRVIKGGGRAVNIIGAELAFSSIVITHGGTPINDPDTAYDAGEQKQRGNADTWESIASGAFAMAGGILGTTFGPIGTLVGAGIGYALGYLFTRTGSLPRQTYQTSINGYRWQIELRSNADQGFATFSIGDPLTDTWLVRERKITLRMDLLRGVVDPRLSGIHIVAVDPQSQADAVDLENIGRTVLLMIYQEA